MKKYLRMWIPLLLAPAAVAVEVNTDYDRSVDFRKYRTFALAEPRIGDRLAGDEFLERRMNAALVEQLQKRGLTPAARGTRPDLYVAYRANAQDRQRISSFPGFGYGGPYWSRWGWGPRYYGWGGRGYGWGNDPWGWDRDLIVTNYLQGTYVIDMVDARENRLVWRAYAQDDGSKLTDLTKEKTIQKVAKEAFEKFPPKSRG